MTLKVTPLDQQLLVHIEDREITPTGIVIDSHTAEYGVGVVVGVGMLAQDIPIGSRVAFQHGHYPKFETDFLIPRECLLAILDEA